MRGFAALCAALAAVLVLGNSAAAEGNPGKSTPPGQEKKTDEAGQGSSPGHVLVPPGQEKKADENSSDQPDSSVLQPVVTTAVEQKEEHGRPASANESSAPPEAKHKAGPRADKAEATNGKKAEAQSRPDKKSSAKGNSVVAHTHVIICHRTGSASNPYVVINISLSAWLRGHSTHPDLDGRSDIVLKMGATPGEKMPRSACGTPGGGGGGNIPQDPPGKPGD